MGEGLGFPLRYSNRDGNPRLINPVNECLWVSLVILGKAVNQSSDTSHLVILLTATLSGPHSTSKRFDCWD
jgi:hypothetical protein